MKKFLVPVYGLSGAGKDTIINAILKKHPKEFHFPKSWTTRKPRFDGEDCHKFVTDEELEKKLLEEKPVTGTNYGGARYILFASEMVSDKVNIRPIDPVGICVCGMFSEELSILPLEIFSLPEVRFDRCLVDAIDKFKKKNSRLADVEESTKIVTEIVERLGRETNQYDLIKFAKSKSIRFDNSFEKKDDKHIDEIVKMIRVNIHK